MKKAYRLLVVLFLFVACGKNEAPGENPEGAPIKIGVILPLSGDTAIYGNNVKNGIELAKKDLGSSIQLLYEDSHCEGKDAVSTATKLITIDHVDAIIGELCSGATLAAAPIAEEYHTIMISPASTSPRLTDAGTYIFRTIPSDALQGKFAAELLIAKNINTLAIIYTNDEYGVGLTNVLAESFTALGGKIVAKESVERGDLDLRTSLQKIKSAEPEALFLSLNSIDTAIAVLEQIKENDLTVQLYSSEALKDSTILSQAGNVSEGMVISSVSSGHDAFTNAYFDAYNSEPGLFSAQGYDAFKALDMAIKESRQNGRPLEEVLPTLSFEGASGTIAFDGNGDVSGNYDVFVVENGRFMKR